MGENAVSRVNHLDSFHGSAETEWSGYRHTNFCTKFLCLTSRVTFVNTSEQAVDVLGFHLKS